MLEKLPSFVGKALDGIRPGVEATMASQDFGDVPETIAVVSTTFGHGQPMPADVSEDGRKVSPPIAWNNVPSGTAAIMLIVEDADSPTPHPLVHAIAYDLPGRDGGLAEGALTDATALGSPGALGKNSFGKAAFLPPDPPSGHGPHRYVFQIFALRQPIVVEKDPGRSAVREAMRGKVIAKGVLIGTYERP